MPISRDHLLGHLFAQVKARAQESLPGTDLEKADFIAGSRMPVQTLVARDRSRRKAVRCPRRAGKSWLVLSIAIEEGLRKPNSVWVVVGLTRPSVRQIFWSLLRKLNVDLELGITFLEVELTATLANGSVIMFRGADNRAEVEKLRGGQYDGCIVDECKSFHPVVFKELIEDVIEPALGDRLGTLILVGTPGDILAGPFYEATCEPAIPFKGADGVTRLSNRLYGTEGDTEALWSLHTWTLAENVEVPHLWTEALRIKRLRGWADDHPTWRREYLGHWVAGTQRLVYAYIPSVHDYDGRLPDGHDWRPVLALDIGFHDSDAIVVWNYAPTSFDVYMTYAEKRPKLNITKLAGWVHEVRHAYCGDQPEVMVGDFGGLATKVFEELAVTHGLPFEPAEKKEKNDFIKIMNGEYDAGRIHVLACPTGTEFKDSINAELLTNRWLEKSIGTKKPVEDPKTPNDLCDAHLYGWRWCDHRRAQPADRLPQPNSTEWWLKRQADEFAKAVKEHLRTHKGPTDDSDMDHDWWTGADSTL